jgi:hypothetical protein
MSSTKRPASPDTDNTEQRETTAQRQRLDTNTNEDQATGAGAGAGAGTGAGEAPSPSNDDGDGDGDSDSSSVVSDLSWEYFEDIKNCVGIVRVEVFRQGEEGKEEPLGSLSVAVDTRDGAMTNAAALVDVAAAAAKLQPEHLHSPARTLGPLLSGTLARQALAGIVKAGMFALHLSPSRGAVAGWLSVSCLMGGHNPLRAHLHMPAPGSDAPDQPAFIRTFARHHLDAVQSWFGECRFPVPSRLLEAMATMPKGLYGSADAVKRVHALGRDVRTVTLKAVLTAIETY